jgi:hypothetical protein
MSHVRAWKDGVVPYRFAPGAGNKLRTRMEEAMATIAKSASVRFRPRGSETDYVTIRPGGSPQSMIGCSGGEQSLYLQPSSPPRDYLHELCHLLGLFHEHTRPDRDQYITVRKENVQDAALLPVLTAIEPRLDLRPYDFASILHYPTDAFAKPGTLTLEPKAELPDGVVPGKGSRLSDGDVTALKQLYG